MNLGLDQLTNSQLLELLQQAWMEVGTRSAYTQYCAVDDNESAAEKLRSFEAMVLEQTGEMRQIERERARAAIAEEIRKAVATGEIRLLSAKDEATIVRDVTMETKIALIDEAVAGLKSRAGKRFTCEINGVYVKLSYGRETIATTTALLPGEIESICHYLKRLVAPMEAPRG